MARQKYYHEPWRKHLETFVDFSGGLNTVTSNDNLSNQELRDLTNKDLGERGSTKRRSGMKRYVTAPAVGKGQGFFRYFKFDGTYDELIAVNGEAYVKKSKLKNPSTAPSLAVQANANSTLAADTYYIVYTWKNLSGETLASPESSITTAAGEEIVVTLPTFPLDVIEANIYIGTVSGGGTLQGSTTTTTYVQSSSLVAGSALPTTNTTNDTVNLTITGLTSFQTTKPVEAVQFDKTLFIATGTDLVEYDGTSAKVVTPYKPEPLEALYIGLNGLSDTPTQYLQDGTSTSLRIDGVTQDKRYGVVNSSTKFTVYVSKPDTMSVEYRAEYSLDEGSTWTEIRTWGTKEINFTPEDTLDYTIRFWARDSATTGTGVQYIMPSYKVYETDKNEPVDTSTIKTCNRILLHWDRLILYGDENQPQQMYVTHLNNPRYFPENHTLKFKNEELEPLNKIVRYRDILVSFTNTSIQAVYGKSPLDFQRVTIHTDIGCIAPDTAKVMGNYIAFLSHEGVQILKSVGFSENRLNVQKIDQRIENIVDIDSDACAEVFDNQYHLVLPQRNKRFRYYYLHEVWTKDESTKLDFSNIQVYDGKLYGQSSTNGHVLVFDDNVWDDDGHVYKDRIETREFDFGLPYSPKKLKELQLLLANFQNDVNDKVYVYADSALVLSPDTSYASVDASGNVVWNTQQTPNIHISSGTTFGTWQMGEDAWGNVESSVHKLRVSGKCRKTKIVMEHDEAKPNQLLGIGYIFKLKKP